MAEVEKVTNDNGKNLLLLEGGGKRRDRSSDIKQYRTINW